MKLIFNIKKMRPKCVCLPAEGYCGFPFPVQNQVLIKNLKFFKIENHSENTNTLITVEDKTDPF